MIKVTSKTDQVLEYLREQIDSGELKPGDQIMPEHKLGKQLSVSVITIRRGLEQLVREGLVYKVRGKGNFVAESKPKLELNEVVNCTVNMIYPGSDGISEKSNVFLGPLINGINYALCDKGLHLRLMPIPTGRNLHWMLSDKSSREMLSGGLIIVNYNPSERDLMALNAFGAPAVIIGHVESKLKPSCIDVDHYSGGRKIADHFINHHGLEKMLYITRNVEQRPHTLDIISGIQSVYQEAGLDYQKQFSTLEIDEELPPRTIIEKLEEEYDQITAQQVVLFHGDELALPLLNVCQKHNLDIPGDIALAAYDNFTIVSEYSLPSITAIGFSAAELGRRAAAIMVDKKLGKTITEPQPAVQTDIIIRESCGCDH